MGKILLFNKWDMSDIKVTDAGLKKYMNLNPVVVPRTAGRYAPISFYKGKIPIVERLINKLMVPGHRGKKHKLTSGRCTGKVETISNALEKAFQIIEEKTKQNPVQVLVKGLENAAIIEEVAAYRLGGIIARKAVITSPQRRLDVALRHLAQGIYKACFKSKKSLSEVLADQLIAAYNNDPKCFAIQVRIRIEKEAEGAR